jgi:spermidine synthase
LRANPWQPVNTMDYAMLGHVLADAGDDAALQYIDPLRPWEPIEAEALTGLLLYRKGSFAGAAQLFRNALVRYREDPWPLPEVMSVAIDTIAKTARDPKAGELATEALSQTYSAYMLDDERGRAFLVASWESKRCAPSTLSALREYEPHVPWKASVLQMRAVCYAAAGLPELAARAQRDLEIFSQGELQRVAN